MVSITTNDTCGDDSAVANATEYRLGIGIRGLKATAKVMPTLRVENEGESDESHAVCVASRRMNLARPFKAGKVSGFGLPSRSDG